MSWQYKKEGLRKRALTKAPPPVERDPATVDAATENQRRLREEFLKRQKAKDAR